MILVHCSNQYQHVLRVSCTFVPINSFRQLLNVSPTTHVYSETSHLEFSFSEVCLTDQNSVPTEIGYIMRYSIEPRDRINVKGNGLLAFAKKWANVRAVSMDKSFVTAPVSNRCSQTASKRVTQKMAEATGDLVEKKNSRED